MNRIEFKAELDSLAQGGKYLLQLVENLANGPSRHLEINEHGTYLHLSDTDLIFQWNVEDPRTAVASLFAIGEYEPIETQILLTLSQFSRTILDIGANIGYYAVVLGKNLQSGSHLFSFEPFPAAYEQLIANVHLNNLSGKVTALPIALSNKEGVAELHIPIVSGTSAASMRILHPDENNNNVNVKTRCLDNVAQDLQIQDIDLIKIDVEGAEWLAFQGGWQTVVKNKPVIFAELLRKWSAGFGYHPNEVVSALREIGYSCYGVSDVLLEINSITEETIETNFLFMNNSPTHIAMSAALRERKLLV